MLTGSALLDSVKHSFDLINRLNLVPFSCPFSLASGTKVVFQTNKAYCTWQWKFHTIILSFATLLAFYKYAVESSTLANKVLNGWKIGFFVLHIHFSLCYPRHAFGMTNFFNEMITFQSRYPNDTYSKSKLIKSMMDFLVSNTNGNGWIFPIGSFVLPTSPCSVLPSTLIGQPLSLRQYWHEGFSIVVGIDVVRRVVTFVATFLVWRIICNLGMLAVNLSMLVSTYCLHESLKVFLEFQKKSDVNFQQLCKTYREVRLMCGLYNDHHKNTIQLGFVVMAPATLAISLFLVITRGDVLGAPALFIFSNLIAIFGAMIMLIFRYSVKIYTTSRSLREVIFKQKVFQDGMQKPQKRKENVKRWKSMSDIKLYFGESSYFDNLTCLILLDFSINMAINLILLGV